MTTFANAINNIEARTQNGMKARASTADALTDFFFKVGAMRGQNPVPAFEAAYSENPILALRIALWARDVRGGAGERKVFRDILNYLEIAYPGTLMTIMHKIPEIGRWDDLLVLKTDRAYAVAVDMIRQALSDSNFLCGKWMPRKGDDAIRLRKALGFTPKQYRKTLVNLTNVVETQMCAKQWSEIDFSKIPSLAAARYKNAFLKNTKETFEAYMAKLVSGDKSVKVNVGGVFPYDVVKDIKSGKGLDFVRGQWNALPNYVGDANVLPMIDVSGSMHQPVGGNNNLMAVDVAVSLGMYLADKNTGKFKDCFLTFSENPSLVQLKGDIVSKYHQVNKSNWGYSTDLHKAFDVILNTAIKNNVSQAEMPQTLLILSDMQFNSCARFDDSAFEMINRKYRDTGYEIPNIVFWNIVDKGTVPVKFNQQGVALVSGFSPMIVKNVLGGKNLTPKEIMIETIMSSRYDF
jgi:hypothetical protein